MPVCSPYKMPFRAAWLSSERRRPFSGRDKFRYHGLQRCPQLFANSSSGRARYGTPGIASRPVALATLNRWRKSSNMNGKPKF
jgi:hypothetical protein